MKRLKRLAKIWDYDKMLLRDYDFDYWYLLHLIRKKVEYMERSMRGAPVEGAEEIADQMAEVIMRLNRAEDYPYCQNLWDAHYEKWGNLVCPVCGGAFCDCFPAEGDGYHVVMIPEEAKTEEEVEQADQEIKYIIREEERLYREDITKAMQIIADHIMEWWW